MWHKEIFIQVGLAMALTSGLCSCVPKQSQTKDTNALAIEAPVDSKAEAIILKSIRKHGGAQYEDIDISFTFRKHQYLAKRKDGVFRYERLLIDSSGTKLQDVLTNEGLVRLVDGQEVGITDKKRAAYTESVNSVIYFVLLPYFLADQAVRSEYLGTVSIKQQPYEKVKITFDQEGGGLDFEDEFIYWFHRDQHTLDYLAYSYLTDGGGARFRAAFNPREIKGLRFADYINYKPNPETRYILNFDSLYEVGGLEKLSLIETLDIQIHE
jgi:hypothetical protein